MATSLAYTADEQLTRLEAVGKRIADRLDWRSRPEVAALIAAVVANPPASALHRNDFAQTRDEWLVYEGRTVSALRTMYERALHVAMEACDAGNTQPWNALRNCDPMYRDGPRAVPSYLWLSSPVDRIIYDAIHGAAA